MKKLLFICSLFFTLAVFSQNHPIGHTTIMFVDPDRGNRQIETEIYYPATVAGEDTPGAIGEYPVIVFGHGFVMAWSAYANLWEEFVPRGYIMAFPRTEGNAFNTDHQRFGWDLQFLVTAMQQEGNDPASVLYDLVAPETALMGHSMGGGASFLAADSLVNNGNTNLKTLIGLAPAESTSNGVSSIASATEITLPSLILSGEQDGVTPPADHHIPMYDNLASDCKTIIHIIGGAHCYFANSNFNCDFGEGTSSTGISITRQEQHEVTFDFVNLWLDYTLKANCNDFTVFNDSLANSPRINFDQVCNGPMTFESTETATICQGDTYTFPDGTTSSTATTHLSTLTSVGGCDSIVETTLSVSNAYNITENASICQGDSYTFPDGTISSTATTHTSTLTSIDGCDSIIVTSLSVLSAYNTTENATICQGDTYTFPDGTTSSTATTHTSNLTSVGGCDSIVVTSLDVLSEFNTTESATICQGDTYTFPDGTTSSTATTHTSNLTSVGGCDSVIVTSLDVLSAYNTTESATICQGDTYTFPDGTTSSTATTHTSTLTSVGGCDSIVVTSLSVLSEFNTTETVTICQGDTYTFPDGTTSSTATTHTSTLTSVGGCDSIVVTSLDVLSEFNTTESATICQGDTYTFPDGTTSSTATTHTSNLTSVGGCDSVIVTSLDVLSAYNTTESATICQGDTYTFPDGTTSSTATTHTSTLTSVGGCDSIVVTSLSVLSEFNTTETVTICQGDTYTFPDGTTSSSSTTHTSVFSSVGGCDSVIVTTLDVLSAYNMTESATICQGDTYTFPDGSTSSTATTHTSNLTAISGCDSIIVTALDVTIIDTNVTANTSALVAEQAGASYQWIDCNNNNPLPSETGVIFEPEQSGSFAVEITLNGCSSLSNCHTFQVANIENEGKSILFNLYPNPSNGNIQIESNRPSTLEVYDSKGSIVFKTEIKQGINHIELGLTKGLYIWKAFDQTQSQSGKLVLK